MKYKKRIIIILIIFSIISILNLYNAKYLNSNFENYYIKQVIFYLLCFGLIYIIKKINIKNIFNQSIWIYTINILLLIIVLIYGNKINGTKAWLNLGFFNFQPSELMKYSLSIFLINNYQKNPLQLFLYTLFPCILVFLEPDTGSLIFYIIIYLIILIKKKLKLRYYIIGISILLLSLISLFFLYYNNQDFLIKIFGSSIFYRFERIINFKNNNYQLSLALRSIFGSKLLRFNFKKILVYIPEGATDFIFAFINGNNGLIIGILIILLYFLLLYNLTKLKMPNKKTNYLLISFKYILFINVLINISMNIGLIPIIGITLPFLSYGGSSLIVNFLFIATILNMADNHYN